MKDDRHSNEKKREFGKIMSSLEKSLQSQKSDSSIRISEDSEDQEADKPTILIANDNYFLLNAFEDLCKPFF